MSAERSKRKIIAGRRLDLKNLYVAVMDSLFCHSPKVEKSMTEK
jgi:hypothetical protein